MFLTINEVIGLTVPGRTTPRIVAVYVELPLRAHRRHDRALRRPGHHRRSRPDLGSSGGVGWIVAVLRRLPLASPVSTAACIIRATSWPAHCSGLAALGIAITSPYAPVRWQRPNGGTSRRGTLLSIRKVCGMTSVSGRRPSRQEARRRSVASCARTRANGVTDPLWFEVPKSAKAPEVRAPRHEAGRRSRVRLGRRRDGAALRRRRGRLRGGAGDPARRHGEPARRPTSASRRTWRRRVAIGLHGPGATRLGVINGERFAVMAGAGFDARSWAASTRRRRSGSAGSRTSAARCTARKRRPRRDEDQGRRSGLVRRQGELRALRERRHDHGRALASSRCAARRRIPRDRRGHRTRTRWTGYAC